MTLYKINYIYKLLFYNTFFLNFFFNIALSMLSRLFGCNHQNTILLLKVYIGTHRGMSKIRSIRENDYLTSFDLSNLCLFDWNVTMTIFFRYVLSIRIFWFTLHTYPRNTQRSVFVASTLWCKNMVYQLR